jgi:hypothetical protein
MNLKDCKNKITNNFLTIVLPIANIDGKMVNTQKSVYVEGYAQEYYHTCKDGEKKRVTIIDGLEYTLSKSELTCPICEKSVVE